MTDITCDGFAAALADLLEREVGEEGRTAMESHALACADCGALLADLRKLRIDAANLPELAPSRDLWSGIAARIETPVVELAAVHPHGGRGLRRGGWARWAAMSAAAAGLVALTAGVTYYVTVQAVGARASERVAAMGDTAAGEARGAARPSAAVVPALEPSPQGVVPAVAERRGAAAVRPEPAARLVVNSARAARAPAETTYEQEITRLGAIMRERRAQLDPVTIGVIERNLQIIDGAIAQCRSALSRDPASRYLMQSLDSALEDKVELLRTAAMLPSRT